MKVSNKNLSMAAFATSIVALFMLSGFAVGIGSGGGGNPSTNITVATSVVNNFGGTAAASSFTIYVQFPNGTNVPGSPVSGSVNGTNFQLKPGTYIVRESSMSGYSESLGAPCMSNGTIALANGTNYKCTFTNSDIPAHVKVVENVVGGPYSASNFAITVGGFNPSPSSFSGSSSGTLVTLGQGNFSVNANEIRFANFTYYLQSYSSGCDGFISLAQNVTCTITSTFTIAKALSVTLDSNVSHVELGGSMAFTANIVGGKSPYTYQILVKNTTSNGKYIYTGLNGTTTNSLVYFIETPPKLGVSFYMIQVTDSLGQTASATVHTVASAQNNGKGGGGP